MLPEQSRISIFNLKRLAGFINCICLWHLPVWFSFGIINQIIPQNGPQGKLSFSHKN